MQRARDMGEEKSLELLRLSEKGSEIRFEIHAKPRSKRSAVVGIKNGALEVSLAAPPAEGLANEELVRLLSEVLGLPKRAVRLARGASSRTKLVEVEGLSRGEVLARLGATLATIAPK